MLHFAAAGQTVSCNCDLGFLEPEKTNVALLYYDRSYNLVLTTFPPPKRLGYRAVQARTFTQVGHMQAAFS